MNKVYLSFKIIKNDEYFEACLDSRLSFKENLYQISKVKKLQIEDLMVYDPNKKIVLDEMIPINEFHLHDYMEFFLF